MTINDLRKLLDLIPYGLDWGTRDFNYRELPHKFTKNWKAFRPNDAWILYLASGKLLVNETDKFEAFHLIRKNLAKTYEWGDKYSEYRGNITNAIEERVNFGYESLPKPKAPTPPAHSDLSAEAVMFQNISRNDWASAMLNPVIEAGP